MFRMNTTNAVRGPARHVNYNSLTGTQGADANYVQSTFYFTSGGAFPGSGAPVVFATGTAAEDGQTPATNLIVCYKQWKNTVRAVTTEYRVRPRDANAPLTYSVVVPSASVNNFELLAGDQRLGGIVPISVFQNLSNDIQGPGGVNYQAQNVKFRARFRIINQATNNTVYNRLVRINSFFSDSSNWTIGGYRLGTFSAAATPVFQPTTPYPNTNGVPPYAYVQVQFPPFEPNEFIDGQIGRFRAVIIAEPVDSTDQGYKDAWPFDDTTNFTLFVMRRLSSFNEDIREYHVINGVPMPSVLKFVNIGGEVNDGDNATNNPPPPRGEFAAANNSQIRLQTPVVQLNRLIDNAEPPTSPGGDELRSFPIDLRTRRKAVLSLAFHRAPKVIDNNTGFMNYIRGWADNTLVGPEPRVAFLEGGPLAQATGGSQPHDQLWVEFARPSLDQINNISTSNIPGAPQFEWNWHPRCCGQTPASTNASPNPAYSIFGGGGFRRGYSAVDVDSPFTLNPDLGLNIDLYDDGKDFEWKKIYLAIPDTIINSPNDGARNFRFRLRVRAIRHTWLNGPNDDADDFFVKNIRILFPTEVTDIEALSIIATWPFVETPASQATQIPLRVRIANNTGRDAQAFKIVVMIAGAGSETIEPWYNSRYVYYRNVTIPFLPGNRDIEVPFPSWNARESNNANTEDYTIGTRIVYPGGDLEPLNDTTYSRFRISFGKSFSYYPSAENNQVPQFTNPFYGQTLVGKGLNTLGFVSSAFTAATAFGADGGSGSGQIAVRFSLSTQDTLLGFQAYFASLNADQNNIRFAVYDDQGQIPAAQPRVNTILRKLRGIDDLDGVPKYDTTSTYLLPTPLVLPPGEYWISVAQLSTVGMELGATGYRSGLQTMNFNQAPVPGGSNIQVYLDKTFRRRQRNGNLLNDVRFAFENSLGSGQWAQFTNTQGNMPYAHLNFQGFLGTQNSYTRGSWIPMLRPYLGDRAFGPRKYVVIDTTPVPVELTVFDGAKRTNAVDLWWETASEKNNSGFYVERRVNSSDTWTDMTFVASNAANGTSTTAQSYAFTDKTVKGGSSYQYRLRQVDLDNTTSYSGILNFSFDGEGVAELGANTPNPFSTTTTIPYTVTAKSNVRLEVVDVLGNVVRTLVNTTVDNGTHSATWDGTDANGMSVANGSYVCRMIIGDRMETVKMSLVR
ncbi:MAG: T9SS type A sorting domain-containing protein [Candidatus Kapabacteria bacterium]|nr:T9SS type A sorting domain-containing protein [Candidatus Kapabacteria bacterium]